MKKFLTMLLSVTVIFTATACSSPSAQSNNNPSAGTQGNESDSEAEAEPVSLDGDITGEITVSLYDPTTYNNYLEEAIRAFEAKYPGTKVNIDAFSSMPEVKTVTNEDGSKMSMIQKKQDDKAEGDYINQINTDLMTGGGADIIAIDVIPFYKYADNGQLEDLSKYMQSDADFNESDYRQNILEAAKYNGGQYIFPLDYSFDYINYDKTLLDEASASQLSQYNGYTIEELIDVAQNVNNANLFSFGGAEGMFRKLLELNYDSFVDVANRTANFTDGKFADMLNRAKEYYEKGYLGEEMAMMIMGNGGNKVGGGAELPPLGEPDNSEEVSQGTVYGIDSQMSLLQAYNDDETTQGRRSVTMRVAGGASNIPSENAEFGGMIKNDNDSIMFDFMQAYGLNSNSSNKRTAWEFIKFLASEEMQTSLNLMGSPININANLEKTKQMITGELYTQLGDFETTEGTDFELTEKQTEILNNYMEAFNNYSDKLNNYMIRDTIIDDMINSEVRYFSDGSKTAEEVANNIQQKVELYLNE